MPCDRYTRVADNIAAIAAHIDATRAIERHGVDDCADLGPVLNQDVELVAAVQQGARSRGFRGPLWSEQESRVRHFHRELDRVLGLKP
jgi:phenylpropionate dioxygenase-like ring-hydroxylating dioxygenase large terminal subunit